MNEDYLRLIVLAKSTKCTNTVPNTIGAVCGSATNASCGDRCDVSLLINNGQIQEMRYTANGCVISRAAAAVLADKVIGSIEQVELIGAPMIRQLLGVDVSPLRERCLTTALAAVQNAIKNYVSRN